MLIIVEILNLVAITIIGLIVILGFIKYRNYKIIYGKHHKNLFYKEIQRKATFILPEEKGVKYKKIKKKLFDAGLNMTVYKYVGIKYLLLIISLMFFINVALTDKSNQITEIVRDINYGKLSTDVRVKPNQDKDKQEEKMISGLKSQIDEENINDKNIKDYIQKAKEYIERSAYETGEGSEIIARRSVQKLIDSKVVNDGIDEYMMAIFLSIIIYFIPDILCLIKGYLIEDKKNWEVVIGIFTYCIFAKVPPYRTSIIVDNIIEVTDVYKNTFEKIGYSIKNGKGEDTINEIIKANSLEDELLELLETIKLTITTGVEKTVENMELLAENTIEWQKIKQASRRNKKYLILIPILLIILMLCFDYVMYGLTEIISNFKIDI